MTLVKLNINGEEKLVFNPHPNPMSLGMIMEYLILGMVGAYPDPHLTPRQTQDILEIAWGKPNFPKSG